MKNTEKTPVGADKVTQYKWVQVDKQGVLMMVDKGKMVVDDSYQREPKADIRIRAIASEWSWVGCGALVVAKRDDGEFYVIDGQHRLLAALRRSDIRHLPCIVFSEMDLSEEARAFLITNSERRPLTGVEKFKAAVTAGNYEAIVVKELADASNRKIGPTSDSNTIRCVSCLSKHVRDNEKMLRRLWPVLVDVCRGHVFSERLVESLMFIEARMPDGESLSNSRWRTRLLDVGFDELHASMAKFSAAYSRGGSRVWALGVAEAINKGLRNRLSIRGFDKESA